MLKKPFLACCFLASAGAALAQGEPGAQDGARTLAPEIEGTAPAQQGAPTPHPFATSDLHGPRGEPGDFLRIYERCLDEALTKQGLLALNALDALGDEPSTASGNKIVAPYGILALLDLLVGETRDARLTAAFLPPKAWCDFGHTWTLTSLGSAFEEAFFLFYRENLDFNWFFRNSLADVTPLNTSYIPLVGFDAWLSQVNDLAHEAFARPYDETIAAADPWSGTGEPLFQIAPNTAYYAASVFTFDGVWDQAFTNVRPGTFHLSTGETKPVPMMGTDLAPIPYEATENFERVVLEFDDSRYAMQLILPAASLRNANWLGHIPPQWMTLHDRADDALAWEGATPEIVVRMPPFKMSANHDLQRLLIDLGLGFLYDDGSAITVFDSAPPLTQVRQVIEFTADQDGARGTAATSASAARGIGPVVVEFNRPFVFTLNDLYSGAILFSGLVNNPDTSEFDDSSLPTMETR